MATPPASAAMPGSSTALPRPPASAPGPAAPGAFEALLSAGGMPPPAEAMASLEVDDTPAEPTDETADDVANEAIPLLATWMQWMRPLDPPAPEPAEQAGVAAPAIADAALSAQTRSLTALARVPAALPPADTAAEPDIVTDAELPLAALRAPPMPEAPAGSDAPAVTAMLKSVDVAAMSPNVMADAGLSAPPPPLALAVQHAQAPATPPPSALINTQHAQWPTQLGERIAWSIDEQQDALIELHPAELGSLSVRVEMRGNDAQVTIVAASPAARDLLQQSLPQLRELLTLQGLNLARAQVERPSQANGTGQPQTDNGSRERGGSSRSRRPISSLLLVDAYA